MVSNHSLSQALTPRRSRVWPTLLLFAAVALMIVMAIVGFLQLGRTERVIIVVQPLAFGQQITAADLATVEVARHRPEQLAGISIPTEVIGKYAARPLAPNDLLQPSMLLSAPPRRPVYPSGEELAPNMVVIPFSLETTGPLTHTDVLNIGFYDESGDPRRCQPAQPASGVTPREDADPASAEAAGAGDPLNATEGVSDTVMTDPDAPADTLAEGGNAPAVQPYACRLLVAVNVLDVDTETASAYLELTPYQAQAIRAVQAANLPLFAERATMGAAPLPALTRLDPSQFTRASLTAPTGTAPSTPASGRTPGATP